MSVEVIIPLVVIVGGFLVLAYLSCKIISEKNVMVSSLVSKVKGWLVFIYMDVHRLSSDLENLVISCPQEFILLSLLLTSLESKAIGTM